MKRVRAILRIAIEYDTLQPVTDVSIERRVKQGLAREGYVVNDIGVTDWMVATVAKVALDKIKMPT